MRIIYLLKLITGTLFIWLCCGCLFTIKAQDSLNVNEMQQVMSRGEQNGFKILIPGERDKYVESDWRKLMRKEAGTTLKKTGNEWLGEYAVLPSLSRDTFTVYTVIERLDGRVRLSTYFMKKDSSFVSTGTDPAAASAIRLFTRDFAVDQYKKSVERQLNEAQDKLSKLEKEVRNLEKENDKSEDRIAKNKREIGRIESDIRNLEVLEKDKGLEILSQQQVLASFLPSAERKEQEEKKLKSLEKERKKIVKNIERKHKEINKLEKENRDHEKDIKKNQKDRIPDKEKEVKEQKTVIDGIEELYKNIR